MLRTRARVSTNENSNHETDEAFLTMRLEAIYAVSPDGNVDSSPMLIPRKLAAKGSG